MNRILQGDTLAPFLFIIVEDCVIRMSVDKINNFADDITLISGSLINAQNLLLSLESAVKCVCLNLNPKPSMSAKQVT